MVFDSVEIFRRLKTLLLMMRHKFPKCKDESEIVKCINKTSINVTNGDERKNQTYRSSVYTRNFVFALKQAMLHFCS